MAVHTSFHLANGGTGRFSLDTWRYTIIRHLSAFCNSLLPCALQLLHVLHEGRETTLPTDTTLQKVAVPTIVGMLAPRTQDPPASLHNRREEVIGNVGGGHFRRTSFDHDAHTVVLFFPRTCTRQRAHTHSSPFFESLFNYCISLVVVAIFLHHRCTDVPALLLLSSLPSLLPSAAASVKTTVF